MNIARCPLCKEDIKADRKLKLKQRLICPVCDAVLEVVRLNPIELDWFCEDEFNFNELDHSDSEWKAKCPLCGEKIETGLNLRLGQHITCPVCHEEIEAVSLYPLELDWHWRRFGMNPLR